MRIFSLWDKGRDAAPDTVRRCFDRWEALNPGHEFIVLDRAAMLAAMPKLGVDPATIAIQAASDILRVHLLATQGGVWTDATVLPARPLDDWLPGSLEGSGMFFFSKPGPGRRVASWFIAAEPGNAFIRRLDAEVADYWDRPRARASLRPRAKALGSDLRRLPRTLLWRLRWLADDLYPVRPEARKTDLYPYFWFHYLVGWLEEADAEARAALAAMAFSPGTLPHLVQQASRSLSHDDFRRAVPMLLKAAPVQKLNWRRPWPEEVFVLPPREEVSR